MAETIVLDPSAVAVGRTQLDITSFIGAAGEGIDWGDASLQSYMADQAVGSSPVDYRLPNRVVKIPLSLRTVGSTSYASIVASLQRKAGLIQREGGWLMRQIDSTPLYADVVNATLHLGGGWLQAYRSADVSASLQIECQPDFYGDEVTLDTLSGTTHIVSKLKQSGADAVIAGDLPGRVRIIVTDTSGNDQKGLLWGFRCSQYSSAATAVLFYEGDTLTGVNGAASAAVTGADGGQALKLASLPAGVWVPFLYTNIASGNQALTHTGTYRVWARCYSSTGAIQLRFIWGVGSLSSPVTNDADVLPASGGWYLIDLGVIRLDKTALGAQPWFGLLQAYSPTDAGDISCDLLYLQPVDDGAGALAYSPVTTPSSISATHQPGTAANDAATGTLDWWMPSWAQARDGQGAAMVFASTGQQSKYLKATSYGFSVPAGATIKGVQARVWIWATGDGTWGYSQNWHLVKAGTIQTGDTGGAWVGTAPDGAWTIFTRGGPTDLWGLTLTPTDVNNSGFGAAITYHADYVTTELNVNIDLIQLQVWFTLASGLTVSQDAVIYASRLAELRTEQMLRTDSGGSVYGPVSIVKGSLPRIPTSGVEARPVELFVKTSRGNLDGQADAGLDSFTAQVKYRPSYLFRT